MISRRSALALAECYEIAFTRVVEDEPSWLYAGYRSRRESHPVLDDSAVYDYLYSCDWPVSFINAATEYASLPHLRRFVMGLHTGETVPDVAQELSDVDRMQAGQQYLLNLAQHMLASPPRGVELTTAMRSAIRELTAALELDGYLLHGGRLVPSEASAVDETEAHGVLEGLVGELRLDSSETGLHHLKLSEDHYAAGRWDDCIANSRKFLEYVLVQCAAKHHQAEHGTPIDQTEYNEPRKIRDYLLAAGLVSGQEHKVISDTYSLLSATGGHAYIAKREEARLNRHLALTWSQFVLLQLKGYLAQHE